MNCSPVREEKGVGKKKQKKKQARRRALDCFRALFLFLSLKAHGLTSRQQQLSDGARLFGDATRDREPVAVGRDERDERGRGG